MDVAREQPHTCMSVAPCQAEDDSTGAELLCSSSFQNTEATRLEPSPPPLVEEENARGPPHTCMSERTFQAENDSTSAELVCSGSFKKSEATEACWYSFEGREAAKRLEPSAELVLSGSFKKSEATETNLYSSIGREGSNIPSAPPLEEENNEATTDGKKCLSSLHNMDQPLEDKEHTLMNDGGTDAKNTGPPEEQEENDNVHQITPKRNVMEKDEMGKIIGYQHLMEEDEIVKICFEIIGYSNDHLKKKGLSSEELDVILYVYGVQFPIKQHLKQILHINRIEELIFDSGLSFISHGDGYLGHLTVLIIDKRKEKCLYFDSLGINKYFGYLNHLFDHSFGLKDSFICLNNKPLQKNQNTCCLFCLDILHKRCHGVEDLLPDPDLGNLDEIVLSNFRKNYVTPLEKYVEKYVKMYVENYVEKYVKKYVNKYAKE